MKRHTRRHISLIATCILLLQLLNGCSTMGGSGTPVPSSSVPSHSSLPEASQSQAQPEAAFAEGYDFTELYAQVASLSGNEAYAFFSGLKDRELTDDQILQFFIGLPISHANESVAKLYEDNGLATYANTYPSGAGIGGYVWKVGSGTQIEGPFTNQNLKLPFTDYIPAQAGTIGDPGKTYTIGCLAGGSTSPWSGNLVDSMVWQGKQYENINVIFQEHLGDDSKFSSIMDTYIAQQVDAIVLHPRSEAVSFPAVERALKAGIPVVTVDMLSGHPQVTAQVAGNFSANGVQNAMALLEKLHEEGSWDANMILIRQPLGGTNDAIRTGFFLKPLSYFPGINILQSYFDNNNKTDAYNNVQAALQAYQNIDVIYAGGGVQTSAALDAVRLANRMSSRPGGKQLIVLSIDDSREALQAMKNGELLCNTPYTPMVGDIGMRVMASILSGETFPQNIVLPNIPAITPDGRTLFGMQTQTVNDWEQYAYGPPLT